MFRQSVSNWRSSMRWVRQRKQRPAFSSPSAVSFASPIQITTDATSSGAVKKSGHPRGAVIGARSILTSATARTTFRTMHIDSRAGGSGVDFGGATGSGTSGNTLGGRLTARIRLAARSISAETSSAPVVIRYIVTEAKKFTPFRFTIVHQGQVLSMPA